MNQTVFTDRDLYAASDSGPKPSIDDVRQGKMGNCWLAAALGAMAHQQPKQIMESIGYNPADQTFSVRLFTADEAGKVVEPVTMTVSQFELADHLATYAADWKNPDGSTRPLWQSVMEVGMAKFFDNDHSNGLDDQGYAYLDRQSGGFAAEAFAVMSGDTRATYGDIDVAEMGTERLHNHLKTAMDEGLPVTIGTMPEKNQRQDGLADRHSYTLVAVGQDRHGEPTLDLRDPRGYNSAGEGRDTNDAVIRVRLKDLVDAGSISEVAIGLEPSKLRQQTSPSDATSLPAGTGDRSQNSPNTSSPNTSSPNTSSLKSFNTGDPDVDALCRVAHDPVASRQQCILMYAGPAGPAFKAQGVADFVQREQLQLQESQAKPVPAEVLESQKTAVAENNASGLTR
jgi:hypothetical protein